MRASVHVDIRRGPRRFSVGTLFRLHPKLYIARHQENPEATRESDRVAVHFINPHDRKGGEGSCVLLDQLLAERPSLSV